MQYAPQIYCIRWLFCWRWMVKKCISLESNCWTLGGETRALWWCLDVLDWRWTWLFWVSSSTYLKYFGGWRIVVVLSNLKNFHYMLLEYILSCKFFVLQLAEDLDARPVWVFNNGTLQMLGDFSFFSLFFSVAMINLFLLLSLLYQFYRSQS